MSHKILMIWVACAMLQGFVIGLTCAYIADRWAGFTVNIIIGMGLCLTMFAFIYFTSGAKP